MKRELKQKIEKANEQIKRLKKWFEENEEAFDYMDLKLHNVSWYCYKDMKNDFPLCYAEDENKYEGTNFDWFCEDSYLFFKEDMMDVHGIDVNKMMQQLGRTSSFYLHDQSVFDLTKKYGMSDWWRDTIVSIVCNYAYDFYYNEYLDYDKEGFVIGVLDKRDEEENIEELNFLIEDMFNDVTKDFEDMLIVYNCIKDFKENQVTCFKDYLEGREHVLQVEKDEREAEEKKCDELLDKFGVSEELHRRLKGLGSSTLEMMKWELNI